jgi:ABC-type uncharacterized transport system substrate-binding protein
MNRKVFCAGVLLFALCLPAEAQQAKVPRIGFIDSIGGPATPSSQFEAFREGLKDFGYIEGKTVYIENRYAEGKLEIMPALVNELVGEKVDLLIVNNTVAIRAAKNSTKTIPILMITAIDPVATGYVSSLARPGGNITGIATVNRELSAKRLELLHETVPKATRVAALLDANQGSGSKAGLTEYKSAARRLRLDLQSLEVRDPSPDLERAFQAVHNQRRDALVVIASPMIRFYMKQIMDLAIKNRLPCMGEGSVFADAGALIAYGSDFDASHRRIAYFVDKILKGAKPGDLPVEQPKKFELAINLKTAKQIGLTIPQSVLFQADRVIK